MKRKYMRVVMICILILGVMSGVSSAKYIVRTWIESTSTTEYEDSWQANEASQPIAPDNKSITINVQTHTFVNDERTGATIEYYNNFFEIAPADYPRTAVTGYTIRYKMILNRETMYAEWSDGSTTIVSEDSWLTNIEMTYGAYCNVFL